MRKDCFSFLTTFFIMMVAGTIAFSDSMTPRDVEYEVRRDTPEIVQYRLTPADQLCMEQNAMLESFREDGAGEVHPQQPLQWPEGELWTIVVAWGKNEEDGGWAYVEAWVDHEPQNNDPDIFCMHVFSWRKDMIPENLQHLVAETL